MYAILTTLVKYVSATDLERVKTELPDFPEVHYSKGVKMLTAVMLRSRGGKMVVQNIPTGLFLKGS